MSSLLSKIAEKRFRIHAAAFLGLILLISMQTAAAADLTKAVVIASPGLVGPEKTAVRMLVEEVEKRARVRWQVQDAMPAADVPAIILERSRNGGPAEGYTIRYETGRAAPLVRVSGNDARGVVFGVGRLLREMRMTRSGVNLADNFNVTTSPKYPIRGHQLGYRATNHTLDGWTVPMMEQYIRDLVVFGTNTIEVLGGGGGGGPQGQAPAGRGGQQGQAPAAGAGANPQSPQPGGGRGEGPNANANMPVPADEMMNAMIRIAQEYGLMVSRQGGTTMQVTAKTAPVDLERAQQNSERNFRSMAQLDAWFVEGISGPGVSPRMLMDSLEKTAIPLRKVHPKAELWVAPHEFSESWMDELFKIIQTEQPPWLTGLVYGPYIRGSVKEMRSRLPERYGIRLYPDVSHPMAGQFPQPEWDLAFALTQGREPISPRPMFYQDAFKAQCPYSKGFVTYSDGASDDINKFVWTALAWDPNVSVHDFTRDYSRYFFGPEFEESYTEAILALEQNWHGLLISNSAVDITFKQFQALERAATPQDLLLNWRHNMYLYRAYTDMYTRHRLIYETGLEQQANDALRKSRRIGTLAAMNAAEQILDKGVTEGVAQDLSQRIFELGEGLYQSIRMQYSTRYFSSAPIRSTTLDFLEVPLNSKEWLKKNFEEIRKVPQEDDRVKAIDALLDRDNPGPGGFYDEMGNPERRPHLLDVHSTKLSDDPEQFETPRDGWQLLGFFKKTQMAVPYTWRWFAETMYLKPMRMRYTGLDANAHYKVRIVYATASESDQVAMIKLVANDKFMIHDFMEKPMPLKAVEFSIPQEATAGGELTLTWSKSLKLTRLLDNLGSENGEENGISRKLLDGSGGPGRGLQIAEVFLIREQR